MVIENSELMLLLRPITNWVCPTLLRVPGRTQWDWGYLLDITICTKDISNSMYKKA